MSPWWIVALIVGADQASKYLVQQLFEPTHSLPLIPQVFHLTYVQNTGAAFGMLKGSTGMLILISVGVMLWAAREMRSPSPRARALRPILALIVGGAVGNLIDRVRVGYVIDFLDFRIWPVFNLADSAITIGVVWLLWQTALKRK